METELYKSRSFSSCIKAAYILISTNIKAIFKSTWMPALLYAMVLAASIMMEIPDKSLVDTGMARPIITSVIMLCIWILDIAISTWFVASIISLLNGENFKKNLTRSIVITLVSLLFMAILWLLIFVSKGVFTSLLTSTKVTTTASVVAPAISILVFSVIFGIVLLPYGFSSMKYLVDHTSKISDLFKKDYVKGWHHWGFLLITLFITIVIICLLALIVFVPLIIIVVAQSINQLGIISGDPSGAPGYFPYLVYATALITMFILAYIMVWAYFVLYYAYGSIETLEKEKHEMMETMQHEITSEN
jgi:MFS family permease